jgi:hypothetical protein
MLMIAMIISAAQIYLKSEWVISTPSRFALTRKYDALPAIAPLLLHP